jgi:hypothetical protein
LEILSVDRDSQSVVLATIAERQFTGEFDLLNDRVRLVNIRAGVDSKVLLQFRYAGM